MYLEELFLYLNLSSSSSLSFERYYLSAESSFAIQVRIKKYQLVRSYPSNSIHLINKHTYARDYKRSGLYGQ